MLKAVNFVYPAVGDKDGAEVLRIKHGYVQAFNGSLAMCSPIPMDIDCQPNAKTLRTALKKYSDNVLQLALTDTGALQVKAGKFKSKIPCSSEALPTIQLPSTRAEINCQLIMDCFKKLLPFVCADPKPDRAWCNGILLKDGQAFATNNVILINLWLGVTIPGEFIIPKQFVEAALSVKETPVEIRISNNAIAFIYARGEWLYGNLIGSKWPSLDPILNNHCQPILIPDGMYEALTELLPFQNSDKEVYFHDGYVATEATDGSSYEFEYSRKEWGAYGLGFMLSLEGVMTSIDLLLYPKPALFFGDNLRGAIVGLKVKDD